MKEKAADAVKKFAAGSEFVDICPWIEENVYDWSKVNQYQGIFDYSAAPKLKLDQYQKDILEVIFTPIPCTCQGPTKKQQTVELCKNCVLGRTGKFPYSEVIWSQPKKHGKTQIAGAVVAWWACKIESPNFILTLASNQEQSAGLIFNSMIPTVYAQGGKVPASLNAAPEVRIPNGTLIKAIPNNYAGQAGGNYGLTAFSELWTWKSERDLRLWEELPPVPTRHNSMRWSETYAGFQNESVVLQAQFARIFGTMNGDVAVPDFTEKRTQKGAVPVPGLEHIQTDGRPSCWHIPEEGFFMFWDHEIRASWITDDYQKARKASTRYSTFVRLWQNRWQSSEGTFLDNPELYDDAVTLDGESWEPMYLAGDASQRNDTTALAGVVRRKVNVFGEMQDRFKVCLIRVWDPDGKDIDLDETIAKYVKLVYDRGCLIGPFRYDPFQMHQVAINLRKMGVPCKEFNQGAERLKADTHLWQQFNKGTIDLYSSPVLEAHVKAANAKEYENEQVRIIKGEASSAKKVDAAVALSMATWAASLKISRPRKRKRISVSMSIFE